MKDSPKITTRRVTARIYAYRKASRLPVTLSVSPDFIDMSQYPGESLEIEWVLATAGFTFPTDGTAIVFTSPGSEKAFGDTLVSLPKKKALSAKKASGKKAAVVAPVDVDAERPKARVKVLASTGLAYAYTITVIDEATKQVSVLDPGAQLPTY